MVLMFRYFFIVSVVIILCGCEGLSTQGPNVPTAEKDSGPDQSVDVSHIPEPVPRPELRTIAGNKTPYHVLGRSYHVMQAPEGYSERGVASWYGRKFHGKRTSNGELYNMYGMTAAHKTLPIPSYVRVKNLSNDKSIIVRVNDRGPFHDGRVIDLSYTGAKKLGFERRGTAEVLVEYIDPVSYQAEQHVSEVERSAVSASGEPKAPLPTHSAGYDLPPNTYLQVGAFGQSASAEALRYKVSQLAEAPIVIVPPKLNESLFKVRVGPFANNLELLNFRALLKEADFPEPHVVNP